MLFPYLPRLNLPSQHPPSKRQWRNIQQQGRLFQRQPLLHLDHLNFILCNKRFSLPFNHRLHLDPLDSLPPLPDLVKPLCASVRTRFCGGLPANEFLLTIGSNLDNSPLLLVRGCLFGLQAPETVSYRIKSYHTVSMC